MQELVLVDARTLAFVSCIGGFIMAATMVGLYAGGTRQRSLLYWAGGGLLYGLGYLTGYVLLTFKPQIPGWVASTLANNQILYGHILILLGIQAHLGRRVWHWLLAVPLLQALSLNIPALRTFPTPFITDTVLMVFPDAFGAWLMWRARAAGLTLWRRVTACFLALFGLFLAVRLAYVLITQAFSSSFDPHLLQILAFLGGMLFAFVITMLLVLQVFREKEMHLRESARRDPLTGLRNRLAMGDLCRREYESAARYRTPVSLIALDLDHFKAINDSHGHAAGDQVLVDVASTLTDQLREADLVFRTGGEEFLIVLPHTPLEPALEVAERLRRAIRAQRWAFGTTTTCSASLGVAEIAVPEESWESAAQRVDRALYAAKSQGRNRVVEATSKEPPE
ncbi:MAG: GGDEF domain-containing protein [Wenzhouxiangellaceae bacterium]